MTAQHPQHPQRCETCKGPCPIFFGSFFDDRMIRKPPIIALTAMVGCASHSSTPARNDSDVPECEIHEGACLKLCDCGNDTFRFVETADWLPEYGWEGDESLRICTKCGRSLGCLNDIKNGRSISRETLKQLRQQVQK